MPGLGPTTSSVTKFEPKPSTGLTTAEPFWRPWQRYPLGSCWSLVQPFGYRARTARKVGSLPKVRRKPVTSLTSAGNVVKYKFGALGTGLQAGFAMGLAPDSHASYTRVRCAIRERTETAYVSEELRGIRNMLGSTCPS